MNVCLLVFSVGKSCSCPRSLSVCFFIQFPLTHAHVATQRANRDARASHSALSSYIRLVVEVVGRQWLSEDHPSPGPTLNLSPSSVWREAVIPSPRKKPLNVSCRFIRGKREVSLLKAHMFFLLQCVCVLHSLCNHQQESRGTWYMHTHVFMVFALFWQLAIMHQLLIPVRNRNVVHLPECVCSQKKRSRDIPAL